MSANSGDGGSEHGSLHKGALPNGSAAPAGPAPPRLLIVDDDECQRRLLQRLLRADGYEVDDAASGAEALAKLRRERVDVVLLDVGLPGDDGFTVCEKIRDALPLPPPIVFVTGHADVADRVHGLDVGGRDYIVKPFDPTELRARVRAAIRARLAVEQLESRAALDPLTGLLNRAQLDERIERAVRGAKRSGRPLSALMIDVDRFKSVNDTFGHLVGDQVLVETAGRLQRVVRPSDMLVRYGGEEFLLLVPDTSTGEAAAIADRLRHFISCEPYTIESADRSRLWITVSIGVGSWRPGEKGDGLIRAADEALYRAKSNGRDRVVVGA